LIIAFGNFITSSFSEGGSSKVPCTDTYSGPEAFSDKEPKALMDFYGTIANKVTAYIAFHSAANILAYPMGYTNTTEEVPNADDLVCRF